MADMDVSSATESIATSDTRLKLPPANTLFSGVLKGLSLPPVIAAATNEGGGGSGSGAA